MNNIKYGLNSNVSTLKTVLLKNPQAAFKSQKTIDLQWQDLNFIDKPDFKKSITQYENFIDILNDTKIPVIISGGSGKPEHFIEVLNTKIKNLMVNIKNIKKSIISKFKSVLKKNFK